jgi:hypothetical protein
MGLNFNPQYPLGYKLPQFRQARRLLLATSQAAGPLWEFRWAPADGKSLCLVNRVTLKGVQIANATAEELRFNFKVARSFTAIDTTNVTSILRSGNNQKLSTKSPASILSGFVESSAATAASGGTFTQDTDSMALGSYVTLATASTTNDGSEDPIFDFQPFLDTGQLLELRPNEGWIINLEVTKGATQGFVLYLEAAWTEAVTLP